MYLAAILFFFLAYLPVFIVILDTVTIPQFKRRISHVPNLIREVTALRCDVYNKRI